MSYIILIYHFYPQNGHFPHFYPNLPYLKYLAIRIMEDKGKEFINPENHETALKDLHERVMLSDQDDERNWYV